MYNFESSSNKETGSQKHAYAPLQTQQKHQGNHLSQSNYSDLQMTSPNPHDIQSFMTSSGPYTQSPEPHQLKKYTEQEMSPATSSSHHQFQIGQSSIILQDFRTPVNNHAQNSKHVSVINKNNYQMPQQMQQSPSNSGVQNSDKVKENNANGNFQINQQNKQTNSNNPQLSGDSHNFKQEGKISKSTFYPMQKTNQQEHYQQQINANHYDQNDQNLIAQAQSQSNSINDQMLINNLDLDRLRTVMKDQYRQYSDEQIELYLQKFLKEYLVKLTLSQQQSQDLDDMFSTNNNQGIQSGSDSDENDSDEDFHNDQDFAEEQEDQSRDSLSTNLDWNDKGEIEKYCIKQRKIQAQKDFRPSQYFGAIKVEELADGIDDSRIDELFTEVFGIKPRKQKRKEHKRKNIPAEQLPLQINSEQNNQPLQLAQNQKVSQVQPQNCKQIPTEKGCNIVLNIYNQYQFMNSQDGSYLKNSQQEDDYAQVLQDKSNMNQKKSSNCQILHQEQQNFNMAKQKSMQQDQLKKYMSPTDMTKLKHQKATSESIELGSNEFQKCCFKTDDNRVLQVQLQQKNQSCKNPQTQVGSPQSQTSIHRHLYNQSITSASNLNGGVNQSVQSLTHQSSHAVLNLSSGLGINQNKHHSNLSLNKQAYKSIIYKHHHSNNSNLNSISSQNSLDNKPKQNKLSYLVAKNLPDGLTSQQDQGKQNLNAAPKPPQNQTLPITQKMGRDSKDSNKQPYNYVPQQEQTQNFYSENSPQVSPKSTLYSQNYQNAPTSINHFKLNSQTFTMQHANQTFQNSKPSLLQQSLQKDNAHPTKTLVQQATENFRKAKQSVQLVCNLSSNESLSSHRSKGQKTLGRNQSQNLFMSQNQINTSVQSFLMSSGDHRQINQEFKNSKIQYLDTEEIQTSPKMFSNKYDQAFLNNTSRPQTAINTNFSLATGINQYMNAASNLGKPPSKLHKAGFLSHNSSAKNLKIQTKGNMTVTQTSQNSQRKQKTNQTSVQDEFLAQTMPNSTRHVNLGNHSKLTPKPLDLGSRERELIQKPQTAKSIERNKMKSSMIQQQYENDLASIERKKQLIQQHQRQQQHLQSSSDQNKSKVGMDKKTSQVGRNQSGISKGKSANQISEFISTYQGSNPKLETQKSSDSSGRMMIKITKSIEKLQQSTKTMGAINKPLNISNGISLISSPTNSHMQQKTFNFPQSTKNSSSTALTAKNQINEMMNHLTSYQSYKKSQIGTTKQGLHEKENMMASTGDIKNFKTTKNSVVNSVYHTNAHSKTRKDNSHIDSNVHKKATDTFKRYLTNTGSQIHHINTFK